MKPRIMKLAGFWVCDGEVGHFRVRAGGETPKESYQSYNTRMNQLILDGKQKNDNDQPRK